MDTNNWNPGTLLEMSGYFWKTCTLHTGVKLGIFSVIGSRSLTGDEICEKINGDKRGVSMLLNALAAMGLLSKKENTYSNTKPSLKFLVRDSPGYVGYMIMHHHHMLESWHQMDEAVLSGKSLRTRASFSDEAVRESFLMGMFNIGMATAPEISKKLDLSGCSNLLDMGGGPGTFAIHFCKENPHLRAKVYDLPTTRPFAEKTIKRFELLDRVEFLEGDFIDDDFKYKDEFDAAWLSHIIHGEGPEEAGLIVKKAVSSLRSGGKIFIHEFILNNTMDGPVFPALFSINMLLGTDRGQSYSELQLFDMLKKSGVKEITRLDYVGPTESGIIMGVV